MYTSSTIHLRTRTCVPRTPLAAAPTQLTLSIFNRKPLPRNQHSLLLYFVAVVRDEASRSAGRVGAVDVVNKLCFRQRRNDGSNSSYGTAVVDGIAKSSGPAEHGERGRFPEATPPFQWIATELACLGV